MRKWFLVFSLVGVFGFAVAAANACEEHNKVQPASADPNAPAASATVASGGCAHAKGSGCSKGGGCCGKFKSSNPAVQTVLASMPAMKYRVGTEETSCAKSAEALAKPDQPIKYVVGDTVYDNKAQATVALTAVLEAELAKLETVQTASPASTGGCPHAAKAATPTVAYRVGGVDYTDKEKAEKAAVLASTKKSEVKLAYKVGDDSFCCDRMAGMKAKETGKSLTYVVSGAETNCPDTAKLLLVQAKIAAVVEAALATQAS